MTQERVTKETTVPAPQFRWSRLREGQSILPTGVYQRPPSERPNHDTVAAIAAWLIGPLAETPRSKPNPDAIPSEAIGSRSGVDLLVWQILLVPERIENAAAAGKADAEDPGEVPHRYCPQQSRRFQ
jgi:hypothetical protein